MKNMFQRIKDIFNKHHKNIKFYSLIFVIIVLLSLALAPTLSNIGIEDNVVTDVFKLKSSSGGGNVTRVKFASNPVAAIHTY
jgi:hypothetical protein